MSQKRKPPGGKPPRAVHVVTDVESAGVSDPFRLRVLGAFSEPRTTKQAAEELGEKPTRLYRHVEALEKAGLLAFRGERRNRGTIERYYQVVAHRFEIDSELFEPGGAGDGTRAALRRLLRAVERELLAAAEAAEDAQAAAPAEEPGPRRFSSSIGGEAPAGGAGRTTDLPDAGAPDGAELPGGCAIPLVARVSGRIRPERLDELREELVRWLDRCQADDDDPDGVEFAGFLSLYRMR